MARGVNAFESHDFYCMCCGNKGIPLSRQVGKNRGAQHRKLLYCIYCQKRVNHIECRNEQEVKAFKEDFENGLYLDEAVAELNYADAHA